ncbi:chromate reductase [Jannaschia faecimaris]|uniref:Chromate reductase n=1 Tax=Jannaschia faecimaris TaxID=1244108 RepID=A0A1H3LRU8_9RHOB|nr:NAD(P)H-dependent oxidoreductase [Jannaschia faecimaris]SDY67050.1 chromate reductase [Jannaschia faecimaris]
MSTAYGPALGLCGSLRRGSFNRKLLLEAGRLFGGVTEANLRLPLYDGDLEEAEGVPAEVQTLAQQIKDAPAVLIACPEYNKAPPGVLKNALDWISRVPGGVWQGKPVAIMSATGGRAGGERTQAALRLNMVPFGADVLTGPDVLVGQASNQFDAEGRLTNEINLKALTTLIEKLRVKAGS